MYKRVVFFGSMLLLFTGCGTVNSTVSKRETIKRDITCYVEDSSFVLKLEDGQIVKYIDSVDGELGQETVDILNQEHLVGVTDNEEALEIMSEALSDLDGYCE